MNTLQRLGSFPTDMPERTAIPVDLEVVCLWSALGLMLTALFLAIGFRVDIQQALMLAG
jgi:hypothetical protein